jgi:hypothetical protein
MSLSVRQQLRQEPVRPPGREQVQVPLPEPVLLPEQVLLPEPMGLPPFLLLLPDRSFH